MDIGGFTHDAQQHLQGVNWPADKPEVVDKAKDGGPSRRVELCAVRWGNPKRKENAIITVIVKKTHGAETVRTSISAPSIEEAVRIAGEGTRLEFPIDEELFFAPQRGYPVAKEGTDYASMALDEA